MKMLIWRPTISQSRSRCQSKLNLALASNSITPTKRSASSRVTGNIVARKKHKQHGLSTLTTSVTSATGGVAASGGSKEKRRIGRRSEREGDGASLCEQVSCTCNAVWEFPEKLSQNHICYHWD